MSDTTTGNAVAILTAAGSGTRLGSVGPKALVEVCGESLLRRAARGLLDSGVIDRITITAPRAYLDPFTAEVTDLTDAGRISVVAGSSASRQASVALGLAAVLETSPDAEVVLVHDAARALTPPDLIRRVVATVRAGHDAVVPGLPVADTVKEVVAVAPRPAGSLPDTALSGAGSLHTDRSKARLGTELYRVVGTPDRERLRAVQTPQGFARRTLELAHRLGADNAKDEARAARDDAALVETMGGQVAVVAGDPLALKVTTPLDLALAEILTRGERTQP
ncbi:2-C-methyl-D-erythritol 4-phosphate cytidylyltransferase [Actinomyces sp.]|uniref:IspD/TarI family cytidylyltransferase n=1 Tax=Actinomyces sp. TaxID=29317 RepID=UPI0026DD4066|nr:IspD/TarI family cytidylyltransferase [Actinomyces sp.]MDO4899718.1 IspD/TarI family cytidylyltransferase [Actinomyces sp.]